jgi:hypothetical protein
MAFNGLLAPGTIEHGLFFLAPDQKLMAVDVQTEPSFQRGVPHALMSSQFGRSTSSMFKYDVTRNGNRFLMVSPAVDTAKAPAPITVMLNWQEKK